MKYLVTGASGFVGGHIARALAERGDEVRALVRPRSKVAELQRYGIELAYGDLLDEGSFSCKLEGIDVVYHCAGIVGDWSRDPESVQAANVQGTRSLMLACEAAGVSRVVLMSSLAVYGIRHHEGTSEEAPMETCGDTYADSKVEAERVVGPFIKDSRTEVVILRPGLIYGTGDTKFVPRIAAALRQGRFVYVSNGENFLNIVHIDDVVQAAWRAATVPGAAGRAYNLTDGRRTSIRRFVSEIAELIDVAPPARRLPLALVRSVAGWQEAKARWTGTEPQFTRSSVERLAISRDFDISRARKELGYEPAVDYKTGLLRTIPSLAPNEPKPVSGVRRMARLYMERHRTLPNRWLHILGIPTMCAGLPILVSGQIAAGLACCFGGLLLQYIGHEIEGSPMGELMLLRRLLQKLRAVREGVA